MASWTAPPPSSGGVGILARCWACWKARATKNRVRDRGHAAFMAEAMRRYFADRSEYMGDPDFYRVPVFRLAEPRYIAGLRQSIDLEHATPSAMLHPGKPAADESSDTSTIRSSTPKETPWP